MVTFQRQAAAKMRNITVVLLAILFTFCLAVPGERVKRYHDIGIGGGGYGGGYGGHSGYGGYGGHGGHGVGYGGHLAIPVAQSYSRSSASSSSVSTGGSYGG